MNLTGSNIAMHTGMDKSVIKYSSLARVVVIGVATAAIVACGGGSGGEQTPAAEVMADDAVIITNATKNISSVVGGSLTSAQSTTTNSGAVAPLIDSEPDVEADGTVGISTDVISDSYEFEDSIADFIRPTLEGGNATQTRDGNTLTIDPDERHICSQWLEGSSDAEIDECALILDDLMVRINAQTDDSGSVTYLIGNQTLANLQYSPNTGSFEIALAGVLTLAQRSESVSGESGELPDVMTGAIKFSGSVTNSAVGREAGSFAIDVTEPMRVAYTATNESLQFGKSTLISMVTDASTGNGTMAMDIKGMQLQMIDDEATGVLSKVNLPDFTLNAELSDRGDTVRLTNTGFGSPLTYTMDGSLVATLAMAKLDAVFKDAIIEFGSSLNLAVDIPDLKAFDDDPSLPDNASANLNLSAPGGTVLKEQPNYSTLVESGSLTYSYSLVDGVENIQANATFTAGDCVDIANDGLELVSCE